MVKWQEGRRGRKGNVQHWVLELRKRTEKSESGRDRLGLIDSIKKSRPKNIWGKLRGETRHLD